MRWGGGGEKMVQKRGVGVYHTAKREREKAKK